MHQLRLGELAKLKLVPHTPYYGSADATPLYLITLHTACSCIGDRDLLERPCCSCRSSTPGFSARQPNFPVQYLGANVPQAWAAGSVFSMMQAFLGPQPDAPHRMLYVDPVLPPWLPI